MQWFDPGVLGDHDNVDEELYHSMSWCLAKIMLLFEQTHGPIASPPHYVDDELQRFFQLAKQLTRTTRHNSSDELLLQIPPFEQWVELATEGGVPKLILDLIRLMAIPDPKNRPTALQVLQSGEYRALQSAAAT